MTSPDLTAADLAARTRETFALLRRLRRAHARQQASNMAFTAYAAAIGLLVYGGLLLPWLRRVSSGDTGTAAPVRLVEAAPPALVAIVLLVLLAVLRDALWRGPVTLPLPAASWLLPLPIDRGRLLRPRLRAQLFLGVLGGAVLGAIAAIVLVIGGRPDGGFWPLLGIGVASFAATGLLAISVATLVARYPAADRWLRRLGPVAVLCALGLAVQSALAGYGHSTGWLIRAELWSGPWGWAVQPLLARDGRSMPGWPVALAALVVLAVALTVVAMIVCSGMPARSLRVRARSVAGFSAGLVAMNPRTAVLEVRAARSRPVRALRLPVPTRAVLIVAWRDATALLRAPSRIAWAILLTAVGFLLVVLSARVGELWGSLGLAAGGLIAGYLAIAQLAEPARLDADDPSRAGHLPFAFDRLALRHAAVPLVLGGVFAEACAVVAAALSGSLVPLLVPLVAVPALVGAALVSAYRGPIPAATMTGMETPVGNLGMVQIALWYAVGPIVAVILLLPPIHIVVGGHAAGTSLVNYVLWGLAVAAILAFWARRRALARAAALRP